MDTIDVDALNITYCGALDYIEKYAELIAKNNTIVSSMNAVIVLLHIKDLVQAPDSIVIDTYNEPIQDINAKARVSYSNNVLRVILTPIHLSWIFANATEPLPLAHSVFLSYLTWHSHREVMDTIRGIAKHIKQLKDKGEEITYLDDSTGTTMQLEKILLMARFNTDNKIQEKPRRVERVCWLSPIHSDFSYYERHYKQDLVLDGDILACCGGSNGCTIHDIPALYRDNYIYDPIDCGYGKISFYELNIVLTIDELLSIFA